ncbi:hypothetical protein DSCO28_05460 [Desulfosarcina ovata subsp. sediminis]|uniref:Uncharacterized protein n=1 Tax=Desulfosarcina ovata subsp. sediminis TaxID=885957 RepID=A0A5K7ZN70_9BACT|nr:hypothetical protein [Desulfosarcina ovata]BBO79980.1 hypothetical protein DSCO28_05460 [Desulfosarcina ovata subsp. sediminis]
MTSQNGNAAPMIAAPIFFVVAMPGRQRSSGWPEVYKPAVYNKSLSRLPDGVVLKYAYGALKI